MDRGNCGFGDSVKPWMTASSEGIDQVLNSESPPMRQYIRHPSDIPIAYKLNDTDGNTSERMRDVSEGGLCFDAGYPMREGMPIHIEIPLESLPFQADGTVAWCRPEGDHYAIGVKFNDMSTDYSVRMVEQVCYIEHYRAQVFEKEGRELTSEEAASEWIDKFAADFPH